METKAYEVDLHSVTEFDYYLKCKPGTYILYPLGCVVPGTLFLFNNKTNGFQCACWVHKIEFVQLNNGKMQKCLLKPVTAV